MSSDNTSSGPDKTTGQFHSTKGTVVETVGNLTGSTNWQQSGKEEHTRGEAEVRAAEAKDYAQGGMDRLVGKKDAVVGAVTGDRQQEVAGNTQQDKGSLKQSLNKPT